MFYIVSYLLASIEEWMFHKYMHLKTNHSIQKNHMLHHANTNNDYKVTNDSYICVDIRNANDFLQFLLFLVGNSGFLYVLFPNVSILTIVATTSGLLAFNIGVWNTYHSHIHGVDPSLCFFGISKKIPIYSDWIIDNHQTHHDFPSGNFNIVFPGADYLFGTNLKMKLAYNSNQIK
jgi:hypothetical protein